MTNLLSKCVSHTKFKKKKKCCIILGLIGIGAPNKFWNIFAVNTKGTYEDAHELMQLAITSYNDESTNKIW